MTILRRAIGCLALFATIASCSDGDGPTTPTEDIDGRVVFHDDTFGNEQFWTDTLRLHEVVVSAVDPLTALSVGLKVDASRLPPGILDSADLSDPATTVALLSLDAVIGLRGTVSDAGELVSLGVTCALCHADVDDSVLDGIGIVQDGWANRDLNPGAILALSPALQDPDVQADLTSWGAGRYDARWNQDGVSDPVLIPPIYGLDGVALETYTGEGPISYWNAYVGVTQMGAQGNFSDPDLGIEVTSDVDLITDKLPALLEFQLTLLPPEPPAGSFDQAAAMRGRQVFEGAGTCASCHTGPRLTDASTTLHDAAETGMDPGYAMRGKTGQYRTTPLRALWHHAPYFHDGSAATLEEVVTHYNETLSLALTPEQQADLVEYLRSL